MLCPPILGAIQEDTAGQNILRATCKAMRPGFFITSCQRVIVDWILTFAKEQIEHIPRVILTGYIKKSTKAKWDAIFERARQGEDIQAEISNAQEAIRSWPLDDLPPSCKCSTLCAFSGRSVVDHREENKDGECTCEICKPSGYFHGSQKSAIKDYRFDFED